MEREAVTPAAGVASSNAARAGRELGERARRASRAAASRRACHRLPWAASGDDVRVDALGRRATPAPSTPGMRRARSSGGVEEGRAFENVFFCVTAVCERERTKRRWTQLDGGRASRCAVRWCACPRQYRRRASICRRSSASRRSRRTRVAGVRSRVVPPRATSRASDFLGRTTNDRGVRRCTADMSEQFCLGFSGLWFRV